MYEKETVAKGSVLDKPMLNQFLSGKISGLFISLEGSSRSLIPVIIDEIAVECYRLQIMPSIYTVKSSEIRKLETKGLSGVDLVIVTLEDDNCSDLLKLLSKIRSEPIGVMITILSTAEKSKNNTKVENMCRGRIHIRENYGSMVQVAYSYVTLVEGQSSINISDYTSKMKKEITEKEFETLYKSNSSNYKDGIKLPVGYHIIGDGFKFSDSDHGSVYAVVGTTGSGKTNLLNLLMKAVECSPTTEYYYYSGKNMGHYQNVTTDLQKPVDLKTAIDNLYNLVTLREMKLRSGHKRKDLTDVVAVFDEYQVCLVSDRDIEDVVTSIKDKLSVIKKYGQTVKVKVFFSSQASWVRENSILNADNVDVVYALKTHKLQVAALMKEEVYRQLNIPERSGEVAVVNNKEGKIGYFNLPFLKLENKLYG